jgi:hypothetical protein
MTKTLATHMLHDVAVDESVCGVPRPAYATEDALKVDCKRCLTAMKRAYTIKPAAVQTTGKGKKKASAYVYKAGSYKPDDFKQCYETHPPYEVAPGIVMFGGSGSHPIHSDCDVYISLTDWRKPGPKSWPWNAGEDIVFPVDDFKVPKDAPEFKKLIAWTADQLRAGRKVHVGCTAGHGRTGMVLAALRATLVGPEQAIQHVRENYCKKAVDTEEQIRWLMTHFGVDHIGPRDRGPRPMVSDYTPSHTSGDVTVLGDEEFKPKRQPGESFIDWLDRVYPMANDGGL